MFDYYMFAMGVLSAPFILVISSYSLHRFFKYNKNRDKSDVVFIMLTNIFFIGLGIVFAGIITPAFILLIIIFMSHKLWDSVPQVDKIYDNLFKEK